MSSSDESFEKKTPKKKQKLRYKQKYCQSWENEAKYKEWLKKSGKGNVFFHCSFCKSDLSCVGGKADLEKHAGSTKHISHVKGLSHQPMITSMLAETSSKLFKDKIKAAELKMACFLAEHNLPFHIAGHLKSLVQSACPDSKIATELTFERTKAQAIITNVTGQAAENQLVSLLQNNQFSLIVDESTDKSRTKHLALIARTAVEFHIRDNFLCLLPIIDGTAISLYKHVIEFFNLKNIPYQKNMVGYASDGANVMFGEHHSLSALFTKDIPHLFKLKCICHSFHLCASYACEKLPRGVEDFARDVYNYIQNSPKRIGDYKDFQCFVNVKPHKLLHPCQTRWLSLLQVVKRLVEQLPALKLYFQGAVFTDRLLAAQSILSKCIEPTTELYLEFLSYALVYFNDLNKEMQSEHPKLYLLYDKIFITYKTILECFLKPQYLELTDEEKSVIDDQEFALQNKIINLDFICEEYHLELSDIYLGGNVAVIIESKKDNICIETLRQFRMKCLEFYIESAKQIKCRFPFEERQQLKGLKFLNPETLLNSTLKRNLPSIAHLSTLFPELAPKNMTEFDREWRVLRNMTLPFSSEDHVEVEDFWRYISKLEKGDRTCMFPLLSEFVRTLLCLPHSSANVERLFSSINLMKTKLRNKLSTKTLTGLLFTKSALLTPCYDVQLSEEYGQLFNSNMYDFKKKSKTTSIIDLSDSDCE